MDIRLNDGASVEIAIDRLNRCLNDAENLAGSSAGKVRDEYAREYVRWVHSAERSLLFFFAPGDVEQLLLTPRYFSLVSPDIAERRLVERVTNEVLGRQRVLAALRDRLSAEHERWNQSACVVVPDTNVFLYTQHVFTAAPWVPVDPSKPIRVVVPMAVVDELDRLKRTGKTEVRTAARHAIRSLFEMVKAPETPTKLGEVYGRAAYLEVLVDPLGHTRLPDPDDEIVDRALYIRQMSGQRVVVVSGDAGMKFRSVAAGVEFAEPPESDLEGSTGVS